jgi:hypothetical protein
LPRFQFKVAEIGYFLSLADGLGLIAPEAGKQLEGLRARADSCVTNLLHSLIAPGPIS